MGRVRGDREAIASSTNSCGTGLRGLTEKGEASSGRTGELRRGFAMQTTVRVPLISAFSNYGISPDGYVANGREGVVATRKCRASEAGVDSIEHGSYIDDAAVAEMK